MAVSIDSFSHSRYTSHQATPHILIVDDDAAILLLLSTFFSKIGYLISVATDGVEALGLFQKAQAHNPVDVVLLDMKMPGMDGLQVREELRTCSDVPVLVLSGIDDDEKILTEAGLADEEFIQKPFSVRHVEDRVKLALNSSPQSDLQKEIS